MTKERSRRALLIACGLGALLVSAALLLPEEWSGTKAGGARGPLVPDLPAFFDALLVALTAAILLSAAIVVVALSLRADPTRPVRRKGPATALAALVLIALVAGLFATTRSGDEGTRSPLGEVEAGSNAAEGGGADGSKPLGVLVTLVVVLLVVGGPVAAWRFARVQVPESVRAEAFDERLLGEIDQGIADLESIDDPRAAIVACYGRLQRLARWSGLEVRPSDTSSEVLDALARRSPALEAGAGRLVALFQTARFSPHAVGEAERTEAMAALTEVRDRLVVPV